jgi:hypothetical protein
MKGADRPYVVVEGTVTFTVELPDEHKYNGQACEDPAIECAMESMPRIMDILLWGEQEKPARVYLEVHEEDFHVEEDNR